LLPVLKGQTLKVKDRGCLQFLMLIYVRAKERHLSYITAYTECLPPETGD